MINHFTSLVFFFILLVSPLLSKGQAPEGMNYQAALRNSSGTPLEFQSVDVRFSIHQNSTSGTIVFTEIQATSTNQFGLINLIIGSTDSLGFSNINWPIGTYFLQVEIDEGTGAGFEDLGTTQLLSVPYALYAKSSGSSLPGPAGNNGFNTLTDTTLADTLSCINGGIEVFVGLDINANSLLDLSERTSSFVICNGNQGNIGPSGLSINWLGTFNSFPLSPNQNDAFYHTIDNIAYIYNTNIWDTLVIGDQETDWEVIGNNLHSVPTENVGIGTITPQYKLTIVDNDPVIADFSSTNSSRSSIRINSSNSNVTTGLILKAGVDSGGISLNPIVNRLFLSNQTPNGKLALNADSTVSISSDYIQLLSNKTIIKRADTIITAAPTSSSNQVIHQNFGSFLTDSLYLLGEGSDSSNFVLSNNGFGKAIWSNVSSLGFQEGLWESNASNIFFDTGDIGIGTSTPTSLLQIQTNSNVPSSVITGLTLSNAVTGGNGANGIGTQIVLQAENNAGVMANASLISSQLLNVTSGNEEGVISFQTLSAGTLGERMRIIGNGNIGIGTTLPNAKLDIIGSFKLTDGSQGNGNVLTSDANGIATWRPRQVAFEARANNIGQIFQNSASALSLVNTPLNDGNGYNPSTNIFTAPTNGVYSFQAQLTLDGGSAATLNLTLELLQNGTIIRRSNENMNSGEQTTISISTTVRLSAGEQISIQAFSDAINTNSAFDTAISNIEGTWFSGHLVYAY